MEDILNELNSDNNLKFLSRAANLNLWESLLKKVNYVSYWYSNNSIEYQEECGKSGIKNYIDLSSIINFKGENIALYL